MATGKHDGSTTFGTPALGLTGRGRANAIPSTAFVPFPAGGQVIAFGAIALNSVALTLNQEHLIFCEDNTCWIRCQAAGPAGAVAGDFPLPLGVVFAYTPRDASEAVISVIQRSGAGNLYIGRSERS